MEILDNISFAYLNQIGDELDRRLGWEFDIKEVVDDACAIAADEKASDTHAPASTATEPNVTFDQCNDEANLMAAAAGMNVGEYFDEFNVDKTKDATSNRNVQRRRNLAKQGHAFPPGMNQVMAEKWRELYDARTTENALGFWSSASRAYNTWRSERLRSGAGGEPALEVSFALVKEFVEFEKKKLVASVKEGIVDRLSGEFVNNLATHQVEPARADGIDFNSGIVATEDMEVIAASATTGDDAAQLAARPTMKVVRQHCPARTSNKTKKRKKPLDPIKVMEQKILMERIDKATNNKEKFNVVDDTQIAGKKGVCKICSKYNGPDFWYRFQHTEDAPEELQRHRTFRGYYDGKGVFKWCPFADPLEMWTEWKKIKEAGYVENYTRNNEKRDSKKSKTEAAPAEIDDGNEHDQKMNNLRNAATNVDWSS